MYTAVPTLVYMLITILVCGEQCTVWLGLSLVQDELLSSRVIANVGGGGVPAQGEGGQG